ncbi:hypothetical protein ACMFMG_001614 [Clarireedia jacksonii]
MDAINENRPEAGRSFTETQTALGSEAAERTLPADILIDHEISTGKENEQRSLVPEQEEEVSAEQEQSSAQSHSTSDTRKQAKENMKAQEMSGREKSPNKDPGRASYSESSRAGRGARSTRTLSTTSRTSTDEYERRIRAVASKDPQASPSRESHARNSQTSASIVAADLPQTDTHSPIKSSSTPYREQSTHEEHSTYRTPNPQSIDIHKRATMVISNNTIHPYGKQNTRTVDIPTMSRERQILPDAIPSPTSPIPSQSNHASQSGPIPPQPTAIPSRSSRIASQSSRIPSLPRSIQHTSTITFSNTTPAGANYTHSSAQTQARPAPWTLAEEKKLEEIFGITISVTEPKGRDDELGGRWNGRRWLRIAIIVVIAFFMGLAEAWLLGIWRTMR